MQLYKATIKLESSLVTPLKGDTIWGHVVWGIANHEGEEAVARFLEEAKSSEPAFVISSAFPKGTICKPYPRHENRKPKMATKDYAEIKKQKKVKFIPASDFVKGVECCSEGNCRFEQVQAMHNTVHRLSNTVEEGLFAVQELWPTQNDFDVYVLSSYGAERIKALLGWAFENGFGADASTGKGRITVDAVLPVETKLATSKYVALAPFVTNLADIKQGTLRADIFVRTGKIGGAFATNMNPHKKTVVMFDEGAVFETTKPIQFIGNVITNVHSDTRICQSGFAPVLPIGDDV